MTTEEELRRVTVGEPERHDAPIHLADPDPAWPALYERVAARVRGALGDRVLMLEHVGSTSVPGLPAKPIIDVVLVVADPADEPAWLPALEAAGYVLRIREPEWYEHRMLRGSDPSLNLHVFGPQADEVARMLAFRDHLRAHADARDRYADEKRRLAARRWRYVQDYADAKGPIVIAIISEALKPDPSSRDTP
jgi:GrpB-like predicted nucleotidyltransferase (UPF0157 family)